MKRDNPEVKRKLLEAIRSGATYEIAAKYAGIGRSTLHRWLAAGRAGDPDYLELAQAVDEAESQGAVQCLALIRKSAMGGTWQAAAWLLERRYPDQYGRTVQRVEHTGLEQMTDEEIERELDRLAEERRGGAAH